jgi:hypothetical protein
LGRQIEYQVPQRKLVSQERLREVLAKHAQDRLSQEIWLASKVHKRGGPLDVFPGVMDRLQRLSSMRKAISEAGLAAANCGKRQGGEVTFADVFKLIYGESL